MAAPARPPPTRTEAPPPAAARWRPRPAAAAVPVGRGRGGAKRGWTSRPGGPRCCRAAAAPPVALTSRLHTGPAGSKGAGHRWGCRARRSQDPRTHRSCGRARKNKLIILQNVHLERTTSKIKRSNITKQFQRSHEMGRDYNCFVFVTIVTILISLCELLWSLHILPVSVWPLNESQIFSAFVVSVDSKKKNVFAEKQSIK